MLDKTTLKNTIAGIMNDMMLRDKNSIEEYATRLSDAVDTYVRGATILYENGLLAPNGAVTGVFNGNLE